MTGPTTREGRGQIVSGWLAPHPPHLVYGDNPPQNEPRSRGGWETLRWAYERCRLKIKTQKPDVIIIHSPHWQTVVGHHITAVPELGGISVDPIFPHLFRYKFQMQVDVELAEAVYDSARALGLTAKKMLNPRFRIDYGTIVSLHMLNPDWDIPVVALSANNSPYFFDDSIAQDQMTRLGEATYQAIKNTGRRALLAASNSLSHLHFSAEPNPELPEDMSREHVYSHAQYEWDMRVLELMRHGQVAQLMRILPDFMRETFAEVKAGGLTWLLAAMGFPEIPAEIYGYGSVIGTGNAIVEWEAPR